MPVAYLLDTNIVSYFVKGNPPAVRQRIAGVELSALSVSAVTESELRFWTASLPLNARSRAAVEDFLMRVPSLSWDSAAAQESAIIKTRLQSNGKALSAPDLMIAAHAISLGLTLVTHDQAFPWVDGLKTEDWTLP